MSVTRNGRPAPKCLFGRQHSWQERHDHEGVYDCLTCWALDDDERDPATPVPVPWDDYIAAKHAPTPRADGAPAGHEGGR